MTGIIISMVVTLFAYTFILKYYHLIRCPRCHSSKVKINRFNDYTQFMCTTCKFSYKDYDSFYNLTPINDQLEIEFTEYDKDETD